MINILKYGKNLRANTQIVKALSFCAASMLLLASQAFAQLISSDMSVASINPSRHSAISNLNVAGRTEAQKFVLESGALFGHNKGSLDQISDHGRRQVYDLAIKLRGMSNVQAMTISGHSDVTNGTGIAGYNVKLSLQRATAIKDYLADLGFDMSRVNVVGMGERQPVKQDCQVPKGVIQSPFGLAKGRASKEEMEEFRLCLQPNRRVEVEIISQQTSNIDVSASNQVAEKIIWLER